MVSLIIKKTFFYDFSFIGSPSNTLSQDFCAGGGYPIRKVKWERKRDQDNFLGPKWHIFEITYLESS